jgi:HEAT repeat protein
LLPALLALLLVASCNQPGRRSWTGRRSAQQQMVLALETTDPDVRREATVAVATSNAVANDWAIDGLGAIARTDPDPQVRCVAITGLSRSGRGEAVDVLLLILHADQHPDRVAPPGPPVRRSSIEGLSALFAAGAAGAEQCRAVCQTVASLLANDTNRNVRLAAARALGALPDPAVLPVLIAALRDADFGVANASSSSLWQLTGMDFRYDVDAWQAWLAETSEPFANAPPPEPKSRPWWDWRR